MTTANLKRTAALSTLWSISQFGSDQIFNFIVYVFLARLLSPTDFGVFVLASIMVEVGKIVGAGGLSSTIVRAPVISDALVDTIFWSNLALSIGIAACYAVLGHPISQLLGIPAAAGVVAVLGLTIPIAALGASHMALNLRRFGHKALAVRSVACGVLGGSLGIAAAFAGWGVWALVVQRLTVETTGAIVAWLSYRWRPGTNLSLAVLRTDGAVGLATAGSQVLTLALYRGQDVIVSHFFPTGTVGAFRNGSKLIEMLSQGIVGPMTGVAVPTLARLREDGAAFNRTVIGMMQTSAIVIVPSVVGMGLIARDLVMALYGPKWFESIVVVQALAFVAVPFAISLFCMSALLVLGRAKLILRLMICHVVLALTACAIAAPFGLVMIIFAFVANEHLWLVVRCWVLNRICGLDVRAVASAVLAPVVSTLLMAAAMIAFGRFVLPDAAIPTTREAITRLFVMVPLGATVYAVSLFAIGGSILRARVLALPGQLFAQRQPQG